MVADQPYVPVRQSCYYRFKTVTSPHAQSKAGLLFRLQVQLSVFPLKWMNLLWGNHIDPGPKPWYLMLICPFVIGHTMQQLAYILQRDTSTPFRNNFQPSFCRKEETPSKDLNGQDPLHSRLNKLENTDVRGSWTHFAQANLAAEPHARTPFHEEWHLHSPLHRLPPVYRPHTQPKNKTHVWAGVVYSMFVIV